jgi:hypothetical protein
VLTALRCVVLLYCNHVQMLQSKLETVQPGTEEHSRATAELQEVSFLLERLQAQQGNGEFPFLFD